MHVKFNNTLFILSALAGLCSLAAAGGVNPWVTSDSTPYDQPVPNAWSVESFHADPAFAGLPPKEFCRKVFDVYYDGRRKNFKDCPAGLTLWSHTSQEPQAVAGLIELDPVLLLNVHGSGYCGIQSGLLEGIYQSRPGGEPGKPAIDARRWFLSGGVIHSVCDAFYDGRWHYYDIDLGGYAGDAEKDVWSIADVIADRKGYYGNKTTIKSKYFFDADGNGAWVEKIDAAKCYAFQDCHMLGHEMSFSLRPGETFTRFFSQEAAGWAELAPPTKKSNEKMKGFCELVYAPKNAAQVAADALATEGGAAIMAIRCPYNITSSRVEAKGAASYSTDFGRTWKPLPADGLVPDAVNRWDYLLKVEGGALTRVTTRGILHPGALPRIDASGPTKMTIASMADYDVLTWIPDWSSAETLAASAKLQGLKWVAEKNMAFSGGKVAGNGELTIPVKAPPGCRLVKLSACAIAGIGSVPDPKKAVELYLGPAGATKLAGRSTDCSEWGLNPATKVDHWQNNVNGSARFAPCTEAEVKLVCKGWGFVRGVRIYAGYVREKPVAPSGTLAITHGFDGKTFVAQVTVAELVKGPQAYAVPDGAKKNEFIAMELKEGPAAAGAVAAAPASSVPGNRRAKAPAASPAAPKRATPAPALTPAPAASVPSEVTTVFKEDWDWASAMRVVAAQGREKNREGVVLSLGDSLTYANQSTRWARNPKGGTDEDKAVLSWSHAGTGDDSDGWHLASLDAPGGGRSETAVSGIRTDEYIRGGKAGIRSLKETIEKYKPQVAFVLLGANDASKGRNPGDVARDMATILDALLANGTIPVLQLAAPRANDAKDDLTRQYNAEYLRLARERKIPVIDLYGEFVTRAPDGAWKTQLLNKDGIHFTTEGAGGPPTPENLAKCGYLLRCWLAVGKLRDIKTQAIGQAK
jgi:lysophospholipase L1-like esterase